MAGFVSEEHAAEWRSASRRHDDAIKAICNKRQAATKPLDDQLKADLDAEYARHREANLALYAAHREATKPALEPFENELKELNRARDAELSAIDARHKAS